MAIRGWEGAIKYPYRVIKEDTGVDYDPAAGSTVTVSNTPVTDEKGDTTDDETKIEVFIGTTKISTADYTLTGSTGTVSIVSGLTPTGRIYVSYYYYPVVGYIQSASVSHTAGLEPIREIGSREPKEIKEGNIEITLSIERCFIDNHLFEVISRDELSKHEFDIELYPKGTGAGNPIITVRGKFGSYTYDMTQDGIIMESVDFSGRQISIGTV